MDGTEFERWKWSSTVSSTTLRRLTIRRCDWYSYEDPIVGDPRGLSYEFDSIGFDTPALTYLDYSDFVPKEYLSVNLDSLVEAKLNLCVYEEGLWDHEHADSFNPMNLIYGLENVEILNLTYETVEMVYVFDKSIPKFEKVSQLSLDLSERCWFALTYAIKKFPNLKTLIIEVLKINKYDGSVRELAQMKHFLGSCHALSW